MLTRTLETLSSQHNGQITVHKSLLGQISIKVDGLTQSGPIITKLWQQVCKQIKPYAQEDPTILILGFGAGSILKPLQQHFPQAHIHALEIDLLMTQLGQKYQLYQPTNKLQLIHQDAFTWLPNQDKTWDLIITDLYTGHIIPTSAQTPSFIKQIKTHLSSNGRTLFNYAISQQNLTNATQYQQLLQQHFAHLKQLKTTINQAYLTSSQPLDC